MKNILVICGPTASGKTSLALSIAKEIFFPRSSVIPDPLRRSFSEASLIGNPSGKSVHILSADSRQIYKGLDIITGKDIPADLPSNIKFFGLDLVSPNQVFNVSDFVAYSQKIITDSAEQNIPLIIVGGTGLYLKAITSNLLDVHVPPDKELRSELEKLTLSDLKKRLEELNPSKYSSLNNSDLNNPRRLIRAIEISYSFKQTNVIPGLTRNPEQFHDQNQNFLWLGLKVDKQIQENKIHQRVLDRLENGAIDEVKKLIPHYPDTSLPIHSSLGVKQIKEYLAGNISKEQLTDLWTKVEVDYARRQMVWFNKQSGIVWYDKDSINQELVASLAEQLK